MRKTGLGVNILFFFQMKMMEILVAATMLSEMFSLLPYIPSSFYGFSTAEFYAWVR